MHAAVSGSVVMFHTSSWSSFNSFFISSGICHLDVSNAWTTSLSTCSFMPPMLGTQLTFGCTCYDLFFWCGIFSKHIHHLCTWLEWCFPHTKIQLVVMYSISFHINCSIISLISVSNSFQKGFASLLHVALVLFFNTFTCILAAIL